MVTVRGTRIYVRTNSSDIIAAIRNLYDQEYDHIRISNPKIIIDVGANIGSSAIFFAKKYPNARIIALEPEEHNFAILLRNTKNYQNITAVKAAVWGSFEKRTIQIRSASYLGFTISDTNNEIESSGQTVNCTTIDGIMKEHDIDSVDLLKMDIEGAEKDVLEKSSGWIDRVDVLCAELHDRICMGCDRAFYLATKDFKTFERHGEKITAYRN